LPYGQGGSACSSAGSQVACWAAAPAAESRSVAAAVIVVRIMMSVLVLGVGAASSSVAAGAGALWLVLWLCCGRCCGGGHRGSLRRHRATKACRDQGWRPTLHDRKAEIENERSEASTKELDQLDLRSQTEWSAYGRAPTASRD
jgi:hypothetical protein